MSLINQVLQDLDRRHAVRGAPAPAAQRAPHVGAEPRPRRAAGAIGAAALTLAIVAGATLVWRHVDASPQPAGAATMPSSTLARVGATTTRLGAEPVDAAFATSVAPSTFATTRADETGAVVDFAASKNTEPAAASAPSTASESAPPSLPIVDASAAIAASKLAATPTPAAPAATVVAAAPARVEKSVPALTASESADLDYRRGIELHAQARGADAEAAFSAALQQDAHHAPARQALAVEWIGRGRADEAERLLREGLAQDAHQPPLAIVLARVQADRHDLRGGIETLRACLGGRANGAEQAEARALMATLQQSAGQHREAIEAYGAALRQAPQNGAWWVGLGLSLAADGRPESASEAFERARATGTLAPELLQYVEQRLRSGTP